MQVDELIQISSTYLLDFYNPDCGGGLLSTTVIVEMAYRHWFNCRTADHVSDASDNRNPPTKTAHTPSTPHNHTKSNVIAHYPNDRKEQPITGYIIAEKGSITPHPPQHSRTSFRAVSSVLAVVLLIASCEMSMILLFAIRR